MKRLLKISPYQINMLICLFETILSFVIILEGNSIYRVIIGRNNVPKYQAIMVICTIILIITFIFENLELAKKLPRILLMLYPVFIFNFIFILVNASHTDNLFDYYMNFVLFFPLAIIIFCLYSIKNKPYQLFYRIEDIMLVFAFLSLILWLCSVIFKVINPTGYIWISWGGEIELKNFLNVFFIRERHTEKLAFLNYKSIMRNIGIFPESPMYNIFLSTSLYTELFFKEKSDFKKILIFLLTMFSTFSTTGFILIIIAFILKYFVNIRNTLKTKQLLVIAIMVVGIISMGILTIIMYNKQIVARGSVTTRIDDYIAGLKAWRSSPVYGIGYDNYGGIQKYMSEFRKSNLGFSNSITAVLAQGGYLFLLLYGGSFIILLSNCLKKGTMKIGLWSIGFFILFVSTIFPYQYIMVLVLAFGYSQLIYRKKDMK